MHQSIFFSSRQDSALHETSRVNEVLPRIHELVQQAKGRGDETAPILPLNRDFASAPTFSFNGMRSKLSLGIAGGLPRDRRDLDHPAYQSLWDHIEALGYEPIIELRSSGNGEISCGYSILSVRIPTQ